MPRKGDNIYKRKDGRWEGRYSKGRANDGKRKYGYVYAKTYREAKQKLTLAKVNADENISEKEEASFLQIAEKWMELKRVSVKESTSNKYANLLENYILPEIGQKDLAKITHTDLEELCANMLISGGKREQGLSKRTVMDTLVVIRGVLSFAQRCGYETACSGKEVKVKQEYKELKVLSKEDQEQLYFYLQQNKTLFDYGILLCLFTGIRVGELCAIQWKDISMEESTIHITKTVQRIQNKSEEIGKKTRVVITSPKSNYSIRTIPIPRHILPLLETIQKEDECFFLSGSKEKFIEPRTMQNYFRRVLIENQIEITNFHALRHTFATNCIELGFDIKSLSEILGHSSVSITLNRYVHSSINQKRKNMELLSELFTVK